MAFKAFYFESKLPDLMYCAEWQLKQQLSAAEPSRQSGFGVVLFDWLADAFVSCGRGAPKFKSYLKV